MSNYRDTIIQFYKDVPAVLDPRLHPHGTRPISTNDDWSGTYPDGTVRGCVSVLSSGELRISFWGNDDTGMELNIPLTVDNYRMWNDWLSGLSYIDMNTLIGLGFQGA